MISRFSAWQRFWGIFATVFLASTVALMATLWPVHEPGIVADLRAPECREWREIPEGALPRDYPQATEQCHSIRALLYQEQIPVRSEDDYDQYLFRARARISLICLGLWAGLMGGVYILGWSSGRLVGALRGARSLKES